MLEASSSADVRRALLQRGAREWCDPQSLVREQAREALRHGEWPSQVVERALASALLDFESVLAQSEMRSPPSGAEPDVLAILPGNIIGPAVTCAYCAAVAGAKLILKSARNEQRLAEIVAAQFERLDPALRPWLTPAYWKGGDDAIEETVFQHARRIIVFAQDNTVASVTARVPASASVIAYGEGFSLAFIPAGADIAHAAAAASWDVAMFDQRGCMSPQTVYVEGDAARAVLFAQALAAALVQREQDLPRARADAAEKVALGDVIRRLQLAALPPVTHAINTVHLGPSAESTPTFVVSVEPYSAPTCVGFGRVAVVKPCANAEAAAQAARSLHSKLETIGIADTVSSGRANLSNGLAQHEPLFMRAGARRVCRLGEMQQPQFGYRPRIADFVVEQP